MIYQTPIIKKMSREGHLARHWRKLRSFPRSIELGALRGYNQSASSSLPVFFHLFPRCRQRSAKNGEYPKHFLYFPICSFICLINLFWTVFMLIWHFFLKQFGSLRCPWCWNAAATSHLKLSSLRSVTNPPVLFCFFLAKEGSLAFSKSKLEET